MLPSNILFNKECCQFTIVCFKVLLNFAEVTIAAKSMNSGMCTNMYASSSSSSFICSNQLNKTHTWATREQEQDKKGTENWRLHFAHKKTKKTNKHTWYKNNYDYAYRKNTEKSTRLSDRLNLDNDEKSTVWGKKFQTFIILSIKKFLRTELTHLGLYNF